MDPYAERKSRLRKEVLRHIDLSRLCKDEEVKEIIEESILRESISNFISLEEKLKLSRELFCSIRKLDILQELVDDPDITEIMLNGTEQIFIEKYGYLMKWNNVFESREKLEDVIQQIVAGCNRIVNESSPIVDARLENGSRVNVVLPPIALNGPIVTIRRFPDTPIGMEYLINCHAITSDAAEFLEKLVYSKYNIMISGGTGSGKTTFLNVLSQFIPKDERVITIEDSAELQLQGICNLVRLETRNANVEECREVTIRDLIKASLRMRPDRVIIGEVRGGEAIDMLQCLNTGHSGISTGHANSASDLLSRVETMALMGMDLPLPAVRRQIASGIDVIVHLGRLRDKSRKVLEIIEVRGYEDGEILTAPLYEFEEKGEEGGKVLGKLEKREELTQINKWKAAGLR